MAASQQSCTLQKDRMDVPVRNTFVDMIGSTCSSPLRRTQSDSTFGNFPQIEALQWDCDSTDGSGLGVDDDGSSDSGEMCRTRTFDFFEPLDLSDSPSELASGIAAASDEASLGSRSVDDAEVSSSSLSPVMEAMAGWGQPPTAQSELLPPPEIGWASPPQSPAPTSFPEPMAYPAPAWVHPGSQQAVAACAETKVGLPEPLQVAWAVEAKMLASSASSICSPVFVVPFGDRGVPFVLVIQPKPTSLKMGPNFVSTEGRGRIFLRCVGDLHATGMRPVLDFRLGARVVGSAADEPQGRGPVCHDFTIAPCRGLSPSMEEFDFSSFVAPGSTHFEIFLEVLAAGQAERR
jgi:hypothetical protein